jgi:hypothetical protein
MPSKSGHSLIITFALMPQTVDLSVSLFNTKSAKDF